MKTYGFTCSMRWIGGSGIVLANSVDEAVALVNEKFKDYYSFEPITEKDIIEVTPENNIVLLTDGDY